MKKKFRHYFLGNLSEEEIEEIDLQIISDQNLADELTNAEDDLMEDFLDAELSERELELFHRNFLISDERTARLKQISGLRIYARKVAEENIIKTENAESEGFFDKLIRLFALNQRPSMAILAVLIVILSGFIIWQIAFEMPVTEISRLKNEAVKLNNQDLSNLDKFKNLTNFSMFSGQTRGNGDENILENGKLTENILLRLAVPPDLSDANDFQVKISGNQNDTVSLNKIRNYNNQNGKEIRLIVPKSLLKKGEYKIEVLPEKNDKYPLNYYFKVN